MNTTQSNNKSVILVNSTDARRAEWVQMLASVGIKANVVGCTVEVDHEIARRWLTATDVILEKKLKGDKADKLRIKILLEGYARLRCHLKSAARYVTASG